MIELNNHPFWDPKYGEQRKRIVKMQERNKKLGLSRAHCPAAAEPAE